jgi:hypothetical protein
MEKKYTGSDRKRLDTIALLKSLSAELKTPAQKNLLLGILIFCLEKIGTWKFDLGFFGIGSELAALIKRGLEITSQNELDDIHKLIYLAPLLKYINTIPLNVELPGYIINSRLYADVKATVKIIVNNLQAEIQKFLKKRPNEAALRTLFAALPEEYKKIKKQDASRDEFMSFISALEEKCEKRKLDMTFVQNETDQIEEMSQGYVYRFATLLYIMLQIEAEKKYQVLSPERSALYKLCQNALHVTHSREISATDKSKYYSALYSFIPHINPLQISPCSWQDPKKFPRANDFFFRMQGHLLAEMNNSHQALAEQNLHPYIMKLCNIINFATQFGINIAIASVSGTLLVIPAGLQIFSKGIGALGRTYYGFPGAMVGRQVGTTIEQGLVSYGVGTSLRTATNGIGISTAPGNAAYMVLTVPTDIATALVEKISTPKKPRTYENIEFLNALLSLPYDILSEEIQSRLKTIDLSMSAVPEEASSSQSMSMRALK